MGLQPVMGHGPVGELGDPYVDNIVRELAAVHIPLGARVVIGQEVREEIPREGACLVSGMARLLEDAREVVEEALSILGRLLLVPRPLVVVA